MTGQYRDASGYYEDNFRRQAIRVQQDIAMIKHELGRNNMDLLTKYLHYTNEFKVLSQEIVDFEMHGQHVKKVDDIESHLIVEEMQKEAMELDPSKIILKLCQVCYKGSHKFNSQEQGNKRHRVVYFMLNNKPLYKFKFECANNKIANRATAYQAIGFLFPGIYDRMVYQAYVTCDKLDLRAFENMLSSVNKEVVREKKQNNIYLRLFDCDITKIVRHDKSSEMAGFKASGKRRDLDPTFSKKVESRMFSTLANTMLQKYAGRSLNFEVKLNKKVAASNSLEGDGKNQYMVTSSDNQATKYFTIVVECQNKMDAKAICGLKFIELHAEDVFRVIWEDIMQNIPFPDSNSNSMNSGHQIENSDFFSITTDDDDDLKQTLGISPPGLPPIKNASTGGGGDFDSRISSFMNSQADMFGFSENSHFGTSIPGTSFTRQFRTDNNETVSTVQDVRMTKKPLRTMNPAFVPSTIGIDSGHMLRPAQEIDPEDSLADQSLEESVPYQKHLEAIFDEPGDNSDSEDGDYGKAPGSGSHPQDSKGGYQFFGSVTLGKDTDRLKDYKAIGESVNKRVKESRDSDDESDSELSKDSDLRDTPEQEDHSEENSERKSSQQSSERSEKQFFDSIDLIFEDYIKMTLQPHGLFDVSAFPVNLSLKLKNGWKGISLIQSCFTSSINQVLIENNARICQYPLARNNTDYLIRYIFETCTDQETEFSSIAYAEFQFSSPRMTFELASNYGMFLILQRTFPQLAALVKSKTIRDALGLDQSDQRNELLLATSFTGTRSNFNNQAREDENNMSAISQPQPFGPPGNMDFSRMDDLSDFNIASGVTQPIKTVSESPAHSYGEDFGTKHFIRAVELYATKNVMVEKYRDSPEAEEIVNWQKIPTNLDDFFGHKLRTMESWELHSVYVHKELAAKCSVNNFFENRIKRKEQFYSNVAKNLIDEDYASVANSLIHTIFKEPMSLIPEANYTIFSLSNKRLVIIEARVQNSKLRKKLASMVVLRLLWKEFYERCVSGDLVKKSG